MTTSQPAKHRATRRGWVFRVGEQLLARLLGRRILAVIWLTFKAAFRYRLVQVLSALLLLAVLGLPAIIKHDGTAEGFTQILLTYTLGAITTLLGFVTLWLACGSLAGDIEECQIQVVAVKPIARWEIWTGKWLGIMALNALLLGISGGTVYGLLQWRVSQLPTPLQQKLRNEILVARGSVQEVINQNSLDQTVDQLLQARLKERPDLSEMDRTLLRDQIRSAVTSRYEQVPSNTWRRWELDFGNKSASLKDEPLYVRAKFSAAEESPSGTYAGVWRVGPEEGQRFESVPMSLAANTFHEFRIPPGLIGEDGILTVDFLNYNDITLIFELQQDMEVLYREGGFTTNFARGLFIILCWLALLSALGLAAASFLSFPVAAFVSAAVLIVAFSTGTMRQIVQEGGVTGVDPDTGLVNVPSLVDKLAVTAFQSLLKVVNLVRGFSPVDALSTGRSITWGEMLSAFLQIVMFMGGLIACFGIWMFTRRELATAQNA